MKNRLSILLSSCVIVSIVAYCFAAPTLKSEGTSKEVYMDSALPAGTNNIGDVDVATITAGETHVGEVGTGGRIVEVTPTVDTSAYTAADLFFDTTAVASAVRVSGGKVVLESITILDEDDNTAAAMTLYVLRSNASMGTINGAINVTDANAREIIGVVPVASGDFADTINSRIACVKNIGLVVQPTTGTTIYIAAACAGTPTQTAGGIKLRLGFRDL